MTWAARQDAATCAQKSWRRRSWALATASRRYPRHARFGVQLHREPTTRNPFVRQRLCPDERCCDPAKELRTLREMAKRSGQLSTAVRAEELRGSCGASMSRKSSTAARTNLPI